MDILGNKVIDFSSVSMSYSSNGGSSRDVVLTDVNFSVKQGELVYLIGKIGSGKSTLLKAIYGEVPVTSGSCTVAGYDITRLKRRQIPKLRRCLGIVFQDYQLLRDRTVYQNLKFALRATGWKNKKDIDKRIESILHVIDLTHKAYKMPHHLSGGEQQRLTIGRALLNNPSVVIADEPTGSLDAQSTNSVMNLFMEIKKMGCTILIATHDLSIIESYPSRTLMFDKGIITEIDVYKAFNIENKIVIEEPQEGEKQEN